MGTGYEIGEAGWAGLLTIVPLVRSGVNDGGGNSGGGNGGGGSEEGSRWTSMADAVESGALEITEVGDGIVGELEAVNRSDAHVLILDGEQLIGAKQNRTTSRTILVGGRSVTRIPVSCMEQGRWRHVGRTMRTGGYHSPSKVRKIARMVEAKDRARREAGRSSGDAGSPSHLLREAQGEVWASIAESSARAGVRSSTGDLFEVYRGKLDVLEERAGRFRPLPGQVGLVAFAGASLLGLDVVGDACTFARLHDRLVRGYLFDALEREQWSDAAPAHGEADPDAGRPDREAVEALLREVAESPRQPLPTAGLGEYRALEGAVVGGELEWDGAVVHLSAFPAD